jgi:undecaprenyl pyrophosphate synthase
MKKSATLKKGLYQISDLASCIMSLRWLWESVAAEEAWEGDGSTLSAKIRSCIGELCACLKDMVDEETGEMLGMMGESDVIAMAEKISKAYQSGALKKANTTATAEQVAELSTKVAAALEALGKQPPVAKGDTTMDDKEKETLAKAQGDLAKALEAQKTAEDALAKATKEKDDAVTAQKKAEGERDEIAKEAKTLADQVMAKGGLRSVPNYDLQRPALALYPWGKEITPIRTEMPRVVSREGDTATRWKAITAINTTQVSAGRCGRRAAAAA